MIMKYYIVIFTIHLFLVTEAQVGIGTSSPDPSAKLDVTSTTKGFLPPRMSTIQRDAISSPTKGLTIYNISSNAFECFNGTAWYSTVHFIGESYGGGIVFYTYDNGQHGLVAANTDQSSGIRWYAGFFQTFPIINAMALANGIGAGKANTAIIIASLGYGDGSSYAARICNEYNVTIDGVTYGDWYLPSKHELNLLYSQKNIVGNFTDNGYWSSTIFNGYDAWYQNFLVGYQSNYYEVNIANVRAIRAF